MRSVHDHLYTSKWTEPKHKREWRLKMMQEHGGGNRQGGGQRQNYNGGGGNNQRPQQQQHQAAQPGIDDFDEDLPF